MSADDNDSDGENEIQTSSNSTQVPQQDQDYASNFIGYFYHYRRHDHNFLAAAAIPQLFGTSNWSQSRGILAQLDGIFLRHCSGRVQSICLDSRRVSQYYQYIPTLSCLKQLDIYNINMSETNLNDLVEWIKLHDSTHGTLRELRMGEVSEYNNHNSIDMRILVRLPQAFKHLAVLDTRCWSEAWAMIDEIQVNSLERLVMDYGEGDTPECGYGFLLRCRSLKTLDIYVPGPEVFNGIVDLFKSNSQHGQYSQSEILSGGSLAPIGYKQGGAIPPVERLYITGHRLNLRDALEDAAVGFSKSLRVLKATSFTHQHDIPKPTLTWGYPLQIVLPFLSELQLYGDIALEFPFSLLCSCPNLVTLKFLVNGVTPWNQGDNPMDEILSLKKLQFLQLRGSWRLTEGFVNGIGTHLATLKMLDLEGCIGVSLNHVMTAVHTMKFLWRVGWNIEDVDKLLLKSWITRVPNISIGSINRNEYLI
ncbi:hypothetical protein BGZ76_005722 [Entomortierella beljakovae]|nr:hypothetical protein BGZ76_005722 [Entomortierella beljakovae]